MTGPNGNAVWNQKDYAFLERTAPDTINPSLWRQAQLNHQHGLFKVVEGLYQVRGIDLSNMTILEGDTGLIVVDPLLSVGNGEGRAGPVLSASSTKTGRRRHLHPYTRRPLGRRQGCGN